MRYLRLSSVITAASLLGGCLAASPTLQNRDRLVTVQTTPTSAATASPQSGWEILAPGMERHYYRPGGEYPLTQFTVVRVDPTLYTFRVHYLPAEPQNVSQWRERLPSAVTFINANFFDPQGNALGLLISDGILFSPAYIGFGGVFQVENGQPRIRSTVREPYAGEVLDQASQAFPMLILDGLPTYERVDGDRASRRTVIGQDTAGRIILLSTSSLFGMRLADLSAYLMQTDLNLVTALNLDGGGSSLMAINVPSAYTIPSFDPVPAVIAVYPRE